MYRTVYSIFFKKVILSFGHSFLQGSSNIQPFCPPKPDDIATICYTSGTTGTPKVSLLKILLSEHEAADIV